MMGRADSFLRLRWLLAFLLSLPWATMGSAAASAERGNFDHCALAAKTPAEIFRKGSATDANLTPRPVDTGGLSTTVKPPPGKSQVIDPARLKQLEAVQDGADHASVRPVDSSRMQEWIDSRGSATPHDFTQELRDAIIRTEKR
jgi:hypothetical protein